MTDQVSENLGQFFEYQWGDEPGQVYLATMEKGDPSTFSQFMVEWPKQKKGIVRHVLANSAEGKDVYYCPSLFVMPEDTVEKNQRGNTAATRANVKGSQVLWVDFDNQSAPKDWAAFAAEKGIPEPSLIVQSSVEGNQHAYWRTEFTSVEEVESRNRALSIALGADRSGWDGNQLLRPPYTANYGYRKPNEHKGWYRGSPVEVRILGSARGGRIESESFSSLGSIERELLDTLQLGDSAPRIEETLAFAKWSKDLFDQFKMTRDEASESSPDKRSGALQKLAYLAAESGFTDEQIYSVLDDADRRWEKYVRRAPAIRDKILRDTIVRARAKIGYLTGEDLTFAGLIGGDATQVVDTPKVAYDFEEFLNTDIEIEWLVEDLLATQGVGLFTGMAGTGKTQLGSQIAINLALGRPNILGWQNPGGAKKVMMLSLEMGHVALKHFMKKMARQYPDELRAIAKNLTIVPLGTDIDMTKSEGLNFTQNLLSEYRPDVLYIDSLQKITSKPLTDEVGSKELLSTLSDLRRKFDMGMYIVHHNRKKGTDPTKEMDLSDLYGSQYLAANVDFVQALRKTAMKGELYVDTWKNRLAMERDPFRIKRNENLQYEIMKESEDGDINLRLIESLDRGTSTDPNEGGTTLSI